jgi:hypothetical protein
MQIGYNNDVEYREKTFHIQTEDRGEASASIETQIFHRGAILDTSIISYEKVLKKTEDVDERIEGIRHMMQLNHKRLYKKLFAGEYDEMVGLERLKKALKIKDADFVPGQDGVPAAALEIERGNVTSLEDDGHESMDLAALQAQLNADAAAAEGLGDEESAADAPTMMFSADDIATTQETPAVKRNGAVIPTFKKTGASAWRGCEPIVGDADITKLVEEFAS